MKTISLEMRPDDAEPILRENAELAARYGAFCDYITSERVANRPNSTPIAEARKDWLTRFLRAKRIVESFGVDYEMTTEGETLTVYAPTKVLKSRLVTIAGLTFRHVEKSEPDLNPKNWSPEYRRDVHAEACRQAAKRVVRKWRESLAQ